MKIYYAHPINSATLQSASIKTKVLQSIKEQVPSIEIIDPSSYDLNDGVDDVEIVRRNQMDISRSDYVIADFTTPSSGVAMETMYAKLVGVPVIAIVNFPASAWVSEMCTGKFSDIDDLMMTIKRIEKENG